MYPRDGLGAVAPPRRLWRNPSGNTSADSFRLGNWRSNTKPSPAAPAAAYARGAASERSAAVMPRGAAHVFNIAPRLPAPCRSLASQWGAVGRRQRRHCHPFRPKSTAKPSGHSAESSSSMMLNGSSTKIARHCSIKSEARSLCRILSLEDNSIRNT